MTAAEDTTFRDWLRTLDSQPAEIPGDTRWNHNVVAATWDYVTQPQPTDTDDDTDGM